MTEPEPEPDEPDDVEAPESFVTTTMTKDFVGRALITPAVNAKDFLGRATVTGDKDHLGRSLVA